MTKPKKPLAIFEQGKATPLLPNSDAEWVDPFNLLLQKLNEEPNDHPLLRSLGAKPSRNSLVQMLITVGLDTVLNYHNRVFIDSNNLSQEFIELLHTPAGQRVVSNLLATMDGKGNNHVSFPMETAATVARNEPTNLPLQKPRIEEVSSVESRSESVVETSELTSVSETPSADHSEKVEVSTPPPKAKLSPLERAKLMSRQSTLTT
ncbi:hypothetical protein P9G84_31130 [Brevibacillus centrosporus]|uniref:hypothetical protein n=1 Tax=Brevibacillus centrosporus TaxID=54910 RepID=UPI0011433EE3|nr:hypothetical protein [Brevibacillus centrosporus]MEC2133311.1 hypothetical protein [Brevibacillus centrosporus]GED33932.1 hypothetical protein BCE02nite_50730 [Brevibacillus centrosporus]